jgi:hypothetical protein
VCRDPGVKSSWGSNLGSLPFWGEISLFCETQVFRLFDQPPSPRIRFPKQASMSSTLRASTPMRTVSRSNRVPSPRKRGTRSLKQRKFLIDAAASRLSLSRRSLLSLARSTTRGDLVRSICSPHSTASQTQPQVAPARRSVSVRAAVKQVRRGGVGLVSRGPRVRRAEARWASESSLG